MRDHHRPRQDLINEVVALRKQVIDLREAMADRRRVEEALRHCEEQLRALIDGCPAGLCSFQTNGAPIAANLSFVRWLGYDSAAELRAMAEVVGVFATREEQTRVLEFACQGEGRSGEVCFRRKDGSARPVSALIGPAEDGARIVVVVEDLSVAGNGDTRSASGQDGA